MLGPSILQTLWTPHTTESSSSVVKLINHYVIGLTNEGKGGL